MHNQTSQTAFQSWEAVCYKRGNPELGIVYEDREILVCRKAPRLPVQSARLGVRSAESILKNYLAEQAKGRHGVPFLGIIQRLDQPVQGLLVFAKNTKAAAELSKQLQNGQLKKNYMAVCHKSVQNMDAQDTNPKNAVDEWTNLVDYLYKDGRTNMSKVVSAQSQDARKAELSYVVEAEHENQALVRVRLKTGRHHQIRVQLAHAGLPIIGDQKYGKQDGQRMLHLCSYEVVFVHPKTKKQMKFSLEKEE